MRGAERARERSSNRRPFARAVPSAQKVMQAEKAKEDLLREKLALAAQLEAARANAQVCDGRYAAAVHRAVTVAGYMAVTAASA